MIFLVFQYFKNLISILVINHVYFFYIVLYLFVSAIFITKFGILWIIINFFLSFFIISLFLVKKELIILLRTVFIFFYVFFSSIFIFVTALVFFILFQQLFGIFLGKIIFMLTLFETIHYNRSVRFDFVSKIDIVKKIPTLKLCKAIIITNIIGFISFKIAKDVFDIYFLFGIRMLFIFFFLGSIRICWLEINNYIDYKYDFVGKNKKVMFVNLYIYNPGFVLQWGFIIVRMLCKIIYELASMRYLLPPIGGMIISPPPMGDSQGEKVVMDITGEDTKELEKGLRNNSTIPEVQTTEIFFLTKLPETPSKHPLTFFFDVINNLEEFRGRNGKDPLYRLYKEQHQIHWKADKNYSAVTHYCFNEFRSCMRTMVIKSTDENGRITAIAYPIDTKHPIDFVVNNEGIQAKEVGFVSGGDIEFNRKKYAHIIEDEKLNFRVVTIWDKLVQPKEMKRFIEEQPDVLRGQEVIKSDTLPNIKEQTINNYFKYASDNFTKVEKTKKGIQENPFSAIMKTPYQKIVHVEQEVVIPVKKGFTFYSYGIPKGKWPTRIK